MSTDSCPTHWVHRFRRKKERTVKNTTILKRNGKNQFAPT